MVYFGGQKLQWLAQNLYVKEVEIGTTTKKAHSFLSEKDQAMDSERCTKDSSCTNQVQLKLSKGGDKMTS
jgi:hypothetical protein